LPLPAVARAEIALERRDLARDRLAVALHEAVVGAAIVEARYVAARERGNHEVALQHLHVQRGALGGLEAALLGRGRNRQRGSKRDGESEATPVHRHVRLWCPAVRYTRVARAPSSP